MRQQEYDKDLFGLRKKRKPQYSATLENYDRSTFAGRLKRLQWLKTIFPKNYGMLADLELHYILIEAKMTFIDGQFISVILLCNAFLEQWLAAYLISFGFEKEAARGMKSILECLGRNRLLGEYLLNKIDKIRKLRNPFVHLKSSDHPERLTNRFVKTLQEPIDILENDAKEALSLMYKISNTKLNKFRPIDKPS